MVGRKDPDRPRIGIVLAGAALLLWPSILNWHPYLFWDTYGYFLQGKAYAQLCLAALGVLPVPAEAGEGWFGAAGRMLARDPSIRSPTWSVVTYATAVAGSFWLLALGNALVAAAAVELALARLFALPPVWRLLLLAVLAAVTSLPWFASFLMPDLYAGLLVLAAVLLAFGWSRLRPGERGRGRRPLCGGADLSHLAAPARHPADAAVGADARHLVRAPPAPAAARAACRCAVALLVALGWLGFGEPSLTPRSPPFLLARAWEDGPARAYLAAVLP